VTYNEYIWKIILWKLKRSLFSMACGERNDDKTRAIIIQTNSLEGKIDPKQ
jgi:hypothetical protein